MVFMFSFFGKFLLSILAYVLLRLLLCALLVIYIINSNKVIGELYPQSYCIGIGEDTYKQCANVSVSGVNLGRRLGNVIPKVNTDVPMVVYKIKGCENNEYIFGQCINGSYYYKKDSNQVKEHQKMIGNPGKSGITRRRVMLSVILAYIFTCVLICALTVLRIFNDNRVIGEVYGNSRQYIKIGEDTYTECSNPGFSANDYGRRLGKVSGGDADPRIVYKINCCENNEYIFVRCCFEGYCYKKDSN